MKATRGRTCMQNGSALSTVRNFDRPENKVGLLGTLPSYLSWSRAWKVRFATKTIWWMRKTSHFTMSSFFSMFWNSIFANCPKHSTITGKQKKISISRRVALLSFTFIYSIRFTSICCMLFSTCFLSVLLRFYIHLFCILFVLLLVVNYLFLVMGKIKFISKGIYFGALNVNGSEERERGTFRNHHKKETLNRIPVRWCLVRFALSRNCVFNGRLSQWRIYPDQSVFTIRFLDDPAQSDCFH